MHNFPSVLENVQDLTKDQIEGLLALAHKFKNQPDMVAGQGLFLGKRPIVANSFLENSTRTRHSFALAIQKLGLTYLDFNAEQSGLKKGESLEETFLTLFAQGVDLCVLRTSKSEELSQFKASPPIKLINGGDGINQHPTQALLDLMTFQEVLGDLQDKKIAIIGDCFHSRVTHSLVALLPLFGAQIRCVGPEIFWMSQADQSGSFSQTANFEESLAWADAVYLLRLQRERHQKMQETRGEEINKILDDYPKNYGLSEERLQKINPQVPVFHPGPANIGVEICSRVIKSPNYRGHHQVVNSIPMRMAIISSILLNGDKNVGIHAGHPIRNL